MSSSACIGYVIASGVVVVAVLGIQLVVDDTSKYTVMVLGVCSFRWQDSLAPSPRHPLHPLPGRSRMQMFIQHSIIGACP